MRSGPEGSRLPAASKSVDGVNDIQGFLDERTESGLALGAIVWSLDAEEDRLSRLREVAGFVDEAAYAASRSDGISLRPAIAVAQLSRSARSVLRAFVVLANVSSRFSQSYSIWVARFRRSSSWASSSSNTGRNAPTVADSSVGPTGRRG
jgi:hypothetical protein